MPKNRERKDFLREILVVDLEATTWENKEHEKDDSEIIEVGCSVLNLRDKTIEKKKEILVKPVIHPILSPFCTQLTSITQEDVDTRGISLLESIYVLMNEFNSREYVWASWGVYDRFMFQKQCQKFSYPYPFGEHHIDVKTLFSLNGGFDYRMGMKAALKKMDINLEGTHHRGVDDSYNISKLLIHILCDGK